MANLLHRLRLRLLVLTLFLVGFSQTLQSEESAGSKAALNLDDEGFVLHGYDPVAYFDNEPVPGKHLYTTRYDGMNFRFASAVNRDKFLQSPEQYIPAYGGYCAFGVRMGSKFDIDPEAYEIVNGKLYVLLNRATEEMWLEDTNRNIEIANNLWPSIQYIAPDKL